MRRCLPVKTDTPKFSEILVLKYLFYQNKPAAASLLAEMNK